MTRSTDRKTLLPSGFLQVTAAVGQTPADLGWQTDDNRFDGWKVENGVIICDYQSSATTLHVAKSEQLR